MGSCLASKLTSLRLVLIQGMLFDRCYSGITSFAAAANAVQVAYGFGYDLSVFLSALGVIAGGDLITGKYSIGGGTFLCSHSITDCL